MKKLIILLPIILGTLCSCNEKNVNIESHVNADSLIIYTSTSVPDSAKIMITQTAVEDTPKKLSYALDGNTVQLFMGEKQIDTIEMYSPVIKSDVSVADYNLDGYDDIFIPLEGYSVGYGLYYCYSNEGGYFYEDEQLNNIARKMTITEDKLLMRSEESENMKTEVYYKWKNGSLDPVKSIDTYTSETDRKVHRDTYSFDENGNKILESEE